MLLEYVFDRDAVINQLCSVIVPPIFLHVGLMHFWGPKFATYLLRKDTFSEKKIKVRPYGKLRAIGFSLCLICLIVYFALYHVWDMSILFSVVLIGYSWIKFRTFFARLEYTHRYITFFTGKKQERFLWKDVTQISWQTTRGSVVYLLKIRFSSGLSAELSSNDFIGLTKLKAFYDAGRYKS